MSADNRKSLLRKVVEFVIFIFLPTLFVGIALWFSVPIWQAIAKELQTRSTYIENVDDYEAEATAIVAPDTSHSNIQLVGNWYSFQQEPTTTPVPIQFATNTPRPELAVTIPPINTEVSPTTEPTQAAIQVEPLVLPTLVFPADAPADLAAPTAVPTRIPPITRNYDLVNVVLLGSDEEITNDNTTRTDTMIIVSINRDTGTVAMLSLPRDMFVYIPGLGMNRLNVAFGWGENVGWEPGGGFGLFRQTIIYNFGINVHYYAKVNITEFEQIVDLVGGVDIAVDCAIQDFYPVAPIEELDLTKPLEENYYLRTLDVGYYTLDGFDAQWYARSRKNSSDFDRGRRQQQVIRAIFSKALASGQITNIPSLWSEGIEIVETNLTLNEALSLVPIALNLESRQIESFTFIPTYHSVAWTTPQGDNVQLPVYETLISLLEDFYTPPTENQVAVRGATIKVLNGTDKPDLDRVAAERLQYSGFAAYPAGTADNTDYADTILYDRTGQTKGSSQFEIMDILNVGRGNTINEPDPNREADFEVILGRNYNSCTFGVLPVENDEE